MGGTWKQEIESWYTPETTPLSGKTGQDTGFLSRLRNTWSNWLKVGLTTLLCRSEVVVTTQTGQTSMSCFSLTCVKDHLWVPYSFVLPTLYNCPVDECCSTKYYVLSKTTIANNCNLPATSLVLVTWQTTVIHFPTTWGSITLNSGPLIVKTKQKHLALKNAKDYTLKMTHN